MQTTILHIHSTEVRPKAKSQKPSETQVKKPRAKWSQSQNPKAKGQRPKAKSQVGMQMGDLLQNAANSTQIRDCGFKMQQIAREAAPDWKTKQNKKTKTRKICIPSGELT